ncbi:MAG: hypothetical protein Q8S18_06640 [Bacteroidales bacterium]|nr:hypothetical protein [Bacteroidales bacterium]
MTHFEIVPLKGLGNLKFGQTIEETIAMIGDAEEIDEMDGEDNMNTVILHYWSHGISIFFEGVEKSVISCFETDNPECKLFDVPVFQMDQKSIIKHMKKNGFKEFETDREEGESRLTFEEGLIDFFYVDGLLSTVNWGVLVNSNGEIEKF